MTEPIAVPRRGPRILAAVLLLLVLVAVAAAFSVDRVLTSLAREEAGRLSAAWQRPVEVGAVRTTILAGLGVRVDGVRIGPGPGEARPLLELDRAELKLELFRALLTRGREIRIRSAELQGLRVTVLRLKDGSTNAQRLADALTGEKPRAPTEAGPPPGEKRAALLGLRVEHAALLGARIAFVDEAAGGRELFIDKLDVVADGLAAGAPLEVQLKAGILSATQNLVLRIHAPPLPVTLIPAPDRVSVQLEPVDLTPLAAFAPRGAGFLGGRLQADLDVLVGAAVPGGAGPTRVRGGFTAAGLRFAGQHGGKELEVTLDADLTADAGKGDLSIGRLRLAFGPAVLEGKGKVKGLRSEHPTIEGLRVVTRQLDLDALGAYYPPLPGLLGGTVAGPIDLALEAAGTAERPVIELRADLTRVGLDFAKRFEKAAGSRLAVTAHLRGGAGGALVFDAQADLAGLDLRPGGALAKKPGDRFTVAVAGTRRVAEGTQALEIGTFTLALLDTTVEAHGTLALAPQATRFDLAVAVDRLDLDKLMLPAPPEASARPGSRPAVRPAVGSAVGSVAMSPWAGVSGGCSLHVGDLTVRRQRVTNLRGVVALKDDEVTFEAARLSIWSGTLSLAGTRVRLGPPDRPFTLAARVDGVQVAAALAPWTDKQVLTGRLDAEVALAGKGATTDALLKALDGTIEGKLLDGVYHGKDLVAEISQPLVRAVPALVRRTGGNGTTSLGKVVPFSVRVQKGGAAFQKPLQVEAHDFSASVGGSATFDGELDMPVTLALSPGVVSELSGGRARVAEPVPFTFVLKGKAWSPHLAGLDVGPAARTIGQALGLQALGKALGIGGPGRGGVTGEADAARKKAAEDAAAARKKLEQDAKRALKKLLGR